MTAQLDKLASDYHLSPDALKAMRELLASQCCFPTDNVVRELGRAGLAYQVYGESKVRLTVEGMKYIETKGNQCQ